MLDGAVKALAIADFVTPIAAKIAAVPIVAIGIIGASAPASWATETNIEQMPAQLEIQFALSALPPACGTRQPFIGLIPVQATNFLNRERAV